MVSEPKYSVAAVLRLPRLVAVCALIVLIAGCGSHARAPEPGPALSESTTAPLKSVFVEWEPLSWRPPIAPLLKSMTPEQKSQRRAQVLADLKANYGLPATTPTPDLQKWVFPEEFGYLFAECMTDAGFPMVGEPNAGAAWVTDPGPTLSHPASVATVQCTARYTIDPITDPPHSSETLAAMWYYYRDYAVPCLAARGFEPDAPLPSRAEYQRAEGAWALYPEPLNSEDLVPRAVKATCPEVPWSVLVLVNE